MFVVDIDQLQSSKNTWNTKNTCFWYFWTKPKKIVWRDFSGKFRKEHITLLVRFFILAGFIVKSSTAEFAGDNTYNEPKSCLNDFFLNYWSDLANFVGLPDSLVRRYFKEPTLSMALTLLKVKNHCNR